MFVIVPSCTDSILGKLLLFDWFEVAVEMFKDHHNESWKCLFGSCHDHVV